MCNTQGFMQYGNLTFIYGNLILWKIDHFYLIALKK